MAVPIRHIDCGEIAMWYTGDNGQGAAEAIIMALWSNVTDLAPEKGD